jgi:hypothetical protein
MRQEELELILKWIGYYSGEMLSEEMLPDAINYAYNMGFTDGRN